MSTETQRTIRTSQRRQALTAPRSASARAYLRNGVPAVYREAWDVPGGNDWYPSKASLDGAAEAFDREDAEYARKAELADLNVTFTMRFLKALEEVLDPIVTLLDCLPAHLDPQLAPLNALHTMADWLGLPFEEHVPDSANEHERHRKLQARQQRLVENGLEINRTRGTKQGLELLLELMFGDPDKPVFTVVDGGYCVVGSAPPDDDERPEPGTFVVHWTEHLHPDVVRAIKHLVEREKPVNARCIYEEPKLSPKRVPDEVNA